MAKYYVVGRVTLQVEGDIEADSQEAAEEKAEELLDCFTPDAPLGITEQIDFEMGDVTLEE